MMKPMKAIMNGENRFFLWLRRGLEDRAVLYSLGNNLRAVLSGPVTAYLIATQFSKDVQGYYYTFGSLLALQLFAELGLGTVITQFASHEWAGLSLRDGQVVGHASNRSRLAGLWRFSFRWYAVASLLFLLGVTGIGLYFLELPLNAGVSWKGPWMALCLLASLRLLMTPAFALLDGCGQVAQTYGFRLVEGLLAAAATWMAIFLGFKLWTAAFVALVSVVAALLFFGASYRRFFASLLDSTIKEQIRWREEVLPMQWRTALNWLGGYFLFQLFTPVLFRYRGPHEAGQFGFTWNMVSSINAIGIAFMQTRAPSFGALIAAQKFSELDRRMKHALGLAILGTSAGSVALLGVIKLLDEFYPAIAERWLGIGPTAVLLVATVLLQIYYAQTSYLRAFKREPYLALSLVSGVLTGGLTWLLGREYGAAGVVWAYLGAVMVVVVPVGTWIFFRRRREWMNATRRESR